MVLVELENDLAFRETEVATNRPMVRRWYMYGDKHLHRWLVAGKQKRSESQNAGIGTSKILCLGISTSIVRALFRRWWQLRTT